MVHHEFRLLAMKLVCLCTVTIGICHAALEETPARLEAIENEKNLGSSIIATASDAFEPTSEQPQPVSQGLAPEETSVEVTPEAVGALVSDSAFLSARKAYQTKHADALEALAEQTKGHPLHGYVELWQILLKLRANPEDPGTVARMVAFIAKHADEYLGERARGEWARIASDHEDTLLFNKLWAKLTWQASEPDLRCARVNITLLEQPNSTNLATAKRLVVDPTSSHFDDCLRLSKSVMRLDPNWAAKQAILWLQQSRWKNLRELFGSKSNASLPFDRKVALEIVNRPKSWYTANRKRLNRVSPWLLSIAALRYANIDRDVAVVLTQKAAKRMNAQMRAVLWGRLGHLAALDFDPKAITYFNAAGDLLGKGLYTANANDLLQWNVRARLRVHDWKGVLQAINTLPENLSKLPVWQYWKAKGLQATHYPKAARTIWMKLRHLPEFYGLLAADALNVPYTLGRDQLMARLPATRFKHFANNPHIQRALRFYAVDLVYEGNREWNWSMRTMLTPERLELAQFAHEMGITHRAITTCESTGKIIRRLMYPMAHENEVRIAAQSAELPADWLFGLIRQESRFITTAKSSVGALGLMQVMPRTARWVAKKIALRDYKNDHLTRLDTNLLIGAHYLSQVSENFNRSIVLSTASYNAGPNRAQAWNASLAHTLEGAIFTETIPFRETRDYVKRVTANMVHYSAYDNAKPRRLTSILGQISPTRDKRIALP